MRSQPNPPQIVTIALQPRAHSFASLASRARQAGTRPWAMIRGHKQDGWI